MRTTQRTEHKIMVSLSKRGWGFLPTSYRTRKAALDTIKRLRTCRYNSERRFAVCKIVTKTTTQYLP